MSQPSTFIVLHFMDNEPLVFNQNNVHFVWGESELRILSKIRFILQHHLMSDVVFAFDADVSGDYDSMHFQYAIAAAYLHEKEKLFPLSMREEAMKQRFIENSSTHYLKGLIL